MWFAKPNLCHVSNLIVYNSDSRSTRPLVSSSNEGYNPRWVNPLTRATVLITVLLSPLLALEHTSAYQTKTLHSKPNFSINRKHANLWTDTFIIKTQNSFSFLSSHLNSNDIVKYIVSDVTHYKVYSIRCNTSECKKSTLRYNANPWTHALIGRCVQRGLIEGETTHHVTSTTHQTVTLICFLWSQQCELIFFTYFHVNVIYRWLLYNTGTQFFLPLTWWRTPKERLIERLCFISTTRETENWQNNDTSMQLKQSHNLCQHTTRFGDILIQPIFMMCWDIGDDYVFFLVRSDQSERITRMAITWSFSCSGSVSALLRQICRTNWDICGAYWRHNATQGADIHSSLFVTKSVTFVSHQNVCVTQCVGSTPPPPLYACFRSLKTSGSRDLCTPTVVRVVGREGIPGN